MFFFFFFCSCSKVKKQEDIKPNIVMIFVDDLGYGVLSCYGGEGIKTVNIDKLAEEGMLFTDFFVPANICAPSRAALLTGRYPMRCGFPVGRSYSYREYYKGYGLHPEEHTIPSLLKSAGYKSMCIGKWHLGFHEEGSHPLDKGFDEHIGIISSYSNSPLNKILYRGKSIVKEHVELEELTKLYTDEAIGFITKNKDNPFFVYLSHVAVHRPLKPRKEFIGTSERGLFGDYIHELDHSTGRVMQALEELGLDKNTIVFFASDNGSTPVSEGSSRGVLLGGKFFTSEGGHRVPGIIRWPGVIKPKEISHTNITSMDILPTICSLASVELPPEVTIDGRNIMKVLNGETKVSPHKFIYYYNGTNLQAVRKGKWKLHLPRKTEDHPFWFEYGGTKCETVRNLLREIDTGLLYNLEEDPGEENDLADRNPVIVEELLMEAARIRKELGDVNIVGSDQRIPPMENPQKR